MEGAFFDTNSTLLCWKKFKDIILKSSLPRLQNDLSEMSVLGFAEYLLSLTKKPLTVDQISSLQIIASIMYFLQDNEKDSMKTRISLLTSTFEIVPTLEPMIVHAFTRSLLEHMEFEDRPSLARVFIIANQIGFKCPMGKAVAVCLLWAIISKVADQELSIHEFRNLSELNTTLPLANIENISMRNFSYLMRSICLLLHLLLCKFFQDSFDTAGYPSSYFRITSNTIKVVRNWALAAQETFAKVYPNHADRVKHSVCKVIFILNFLTDNKAEYCLMCDGTMPLPNGKDICTIGIACKK